MSTLKYPDTLTDGSLGQKTSAASQSVVIASDNTVSVDQDVVTCPSNSSTANLNSSATFTGTGVSTLGVSGIQICLKADQDCTVLVEQSTNNTNWDISDSFNYYKLTNNFGMTIQAVSSYVRVKVTNIGASATTVFRLQTVLCPMVEAVPRALDANGFLKSSVVDMYNWDSGNKFRIDQFNTLKTGEITRLVGATFHGTTKDTNFWAESVVGTGAVAQSLGAVTLTTGATANSTAQYQSVRNARFIADCTNIFRGVVKVGDTGTTDNIRRWGAYNATSGVFFELSGTSLRCVTRYNSSDTPIAQASWTKFNRFTLDTNYHGYEIWMGFQGAQFFIDGVLVHTVAMEATPYTDSLTLPATIQNNNSNGSTSNVSISTILLAIARLGKLQTQPTSKNISSNATTVLKYGAGNLHAVVVNKGGAGNTATIYDNTAASGTLIGTITIPSGGGTLDYKGLPFSTGLTIVTASGSASDLTVIYE